ncbi:MAG: PEGA domain-containing protein [Myxococcota bacterium]|nr:PEGA domain-containing protein [Myxococcota bacterium]
MTAKVSTSIAAALLALALTHTGVASAQRCALLPPGEPPEGAPAPEAMQDSARASVVSGLEAEGVTVMPSDEAPLEGALAECNALECGGQVVGTLGVDFAVLVTVWAPRGTPTSVVVTLIGADDATAGDAPVVAGDLAGAAREALQAAWQRWRSSRLGRLEIRSEPTGAAVSVDAQPVGETPLSHEVLAGQRVVRLELDGHRPEERTLDVATGQVAEIDVTLEPEGDTDPGTTGTYTEPHWANWVIGGALAAAGVVALISPLQTAAREGECVDAPAPGFCRTEVRFGAASGVLTGVGVAALIGGAVFFIAQPIQMSTVITPDSASLQLSGTF